MAPITLYYFTASPPCRGVLLTARNLGLDIKIKDVDLLTGEHLQDWFLKINPQHTLPAIDDNGHIICDSKAICQYLVNSRAPGSTLYPIDAKRRSIVDARLFFDSCSVMGRLANVEKFVLEGGTEIPEKMKEGIYEVMQWLNDYLTNQKWVAGDILTIADLTLLATISSYIALGVSTYRYPEVRRWYDQSMSLPGWTENESGAKQFGKMFGSNLKKGF